MENNPALERWFSGSRESSPRTDDGSRAAMLLSSRAGVAGGRALNPAQKCWAIFDRLGGGAADSCHRRTIAEAAKNTETALDPPLPQVEVHVQ